MFRWPTVLVVWGTWGNIDNTLLSQMWVSTSASSALTDLRYFSSIVSGTSIIGETSLSVTGVSRLSDKIEEMNILRAMCCTTLFGTAFKKGRNEGLMPWTTACSATENDWSNESANSRVDNFLLHQPVFEKTEGQIYCSNGESMGIKPVAKIPWLLICTELWGRWSTGASTVTWNCFVAEETMWAKVRLVAGGMSPNSTSLG